MNLGFSEIIVIFLVGIIFFGPDKLPDFIKNVAKFYKQVTEWKDQVTSSFDDILNSETINEPSKDCDTKLPEEQGDDVEPHWFEGSLPKELNSKPKEAPKDKNDIS